MAVPFQLLALLLCLWSLTLVCSFNLEPRIPIVKRGSPKSHFGYTVAQHQTILDKITGGTYTKSWLLVGAPKDKNLQPGTNSSGALWKCPISTYTTDCTQVKTDGFRDVNEELADPAEDEIKEDQWLGVTLKSQGPGGKVLVCAHRYQHKVKGVPWGFGLCYILSQTLDLDDYLEPCLGGKTDEGHQQYGFCQAGTSGLLLGDEAVLGVPGLYTWRGTVHTSNISDDYLLKDKTKYFGPVTKNDSPVDKYSYLGYSVAAGRFFGNYMSYVGGAPRANETGQVVFFTRERMGKSQLRVDLTLQGEMFASSYGFEILAVDINGDRRDDLIVGAPFYYTSSSSGAVYVYMNNDGGFTENHPYTKIEGAAGESRFGFSMTSLGFLNHDEYKDIAIGAPYEGRGAIYIYLGTSEGLMTTPAQVIHAEDMPGTPYDAFGYALSGGMDLDGNGYPDLLTSSFCSDRILLIRARPIINITTDVQSENLTNIDPTKKNCKDGDVAETCFSFDACFKMDSEKGTKTGLRLKYTIEETSERPIVRVRFGEGQKDQPSIIRRDIKLLPEVGVFQCNTETVYLLDGPRNTLQPLKFKLSYEIQQDEPHPVKEGDPLPSIDNYPILNQQEAVKHFRGTFVKDCKSDTCVSDLNVEGRLDLQKHETHNRYLLRLGEQDTVNLHVEVTNTLEPAYHSNLLVTHYQALTFDQRESQTGSHECTSTSTQVQCDIGHPLKNTTGPLILSFKESGFPFDSKYIEFTVAANSSSREETHQDRLKFLVEVIKRAEISIIGSVAPEQAFYGGEVVGESEIKKVDQVGMEITHKYVIDNRGPWRVDELQVEVEWPYQVENNKEHGKWLLYMTEIPTVDGIGECEIAPNRVNNRHMMHKLVPEVEGELETTDLPSPDGSESQAPTDSELETRVGSTKVTKTITKKVTGSTTTLKKQTFKSSSTKEHSASTERTSHEFSSSSSGSSGSSASSFSSSSGYSETGSVDGETGSVDGETEGSGYGQETGRQRGNTHARVSRTVFPPAHKTKFTDDDFRINILGGDSEDEDGNVVSHHEESHSSTRTSPDGTTTFTEHHHESKKVIVKEGSIEDIPRGKWSQSGGYRETHTETSSGGAAHIPERRGHWEEESRTDQSGDRQFQGGIGVDDETAEGSGLYDGFHRSGQDWKAESGIRRVETVNREETIRRTHSGGFGSYDSHNRTEQSGIHRVGVDDRGETIRTHSGRNEDEHDQTYIDESATQRGGSTIHYSGHDRRVTDDNKRIYDHDGESDIGANRYEGSIRTDGIYRSQHSLTTVDSGEPIRGTDDYRKIATEDSRTTYGSYDSRGTNIDGIERNVGRGHHRGSTSVDGYSSGSDVRGTQLENRDRIAENQGFRPYSYDGTSSNRGSSRTNYGNFDRPGASDNLRKDFGRFETSSESVGTYSGQDSRHHGRDRHRTAFDWNDKRSQEQSHLDNQDGGESSRATQVREHNRYNQDGTLRHTHTYEASRTTGEGSRGHSGGNWRTSGNEADGAQDSRQTSHTNLRTSSYDLNSGAGEHHRGRWNTQSGQGGRDHTNLRTSYDLNSGAGEHHRTRWNTQSGQGGRDHTNLRTSYDLNSGAGEHHRVRWNTQSGQGGKDQTFGQRKGSTGLNLNEFRNAVPDENGTYTRVVVDPVTGETTLYTKRVIYTRNFQDNSERRPYSERSDSASSTSSQHIRSRRELKRVKREKELIIKPQAVTDAQTGKTMQVVNLRCDGDVPTAKCFTFTCNIRNLGARQAASIRIKSRLWNSTLVEDYPRVSYVSIKSKAKLLLPEDIRKDQDQSDDVASAETLAYPDLLDQLPPEEVPLWVILVSIFAGLLVLIIIVLILWKLGFFERKRPDPTLSGNLDKDANGY